MTRPCLSWVWLNNQQPASNRSRKRKKSDAMTEYHALREKGPADPAFSGE